MRKIFTVLMLVLACRANATDGLFDFFKNKTAPPASGKLLIFYRADCRYCENMSKVLEKEKGFVQLLEQHFNIQLMNIESEEGRLLADKFNVHAVPSVVKYESNTGDWFKIKGFPGIAKLATLLGLEYTAAPVTEPSAAVNMACGDGIVQGGEACDDGNLVNGDGCTSSCTIQPGFFCTGSPSVCGTVCGDGIKAGAELCDDGNTTNGDGCNATCNTESGYSCSGSPSVCTPTCGDGIKTGAEQCDDGNTTNGDGCSATCTIQPGFFCAGSPSVCATVCGDGIVAGSETCDDGNVVNGDGCNNTCNVESGYSCSGSPSVCTGPPPNDDCLNAITLSGTSGTTGGTNVNATNPSPAVTFSCGAGAQKDVWYKFTLASSTYIRIGVNPGTLLDPVVVVYRGSCGALIEMLCNDDINPPLRASLVTGTLAPNTYFVRVLGFGLTGGTFSLVYNLTGAGCGDGIVQSGEECDDGNISPNDGCSSACLFENTAGIKGVAINREGVRADPSAMLDVKSFDAGVLIPRMSSTQRTAIVSPAKGLLVFDITTNTFWYYKTGWVEIDAAGTGFGVTNSNTVTFNAASNYTPAWPTELYDDGSNFAANNFTVPQAGVYQFTATYTINTSAAPLAFSLNADIRSSAITIYAANTIINPTSSTGITTVNVTGMAKLTAGTIVYSTLTKSAASTSNITGSTFNGYRVY